MPILGVFLPKTNFGAGIPDIDLLRVLLFFLMFFFFGNLAIIKYGIKLFNKWICIIIIFTIIVIASVAWSNYSYNTFTIQLLFFAVFIPLFMAMVALNLFIEKNNVHVYIKHIITSSCILSLVSIYQLLIGNVAHDEEFRAVATLGNPNLLAIFLVLTLPCIIYGIEKQIVRNELRWLVPLFVIGGIVSTVSRKGLITMIFAFFLYYILKKQFKKVILLGATFTILGVLFFGYTAISHRFNKEKFKSDRESKSNMVYAGWKMFLKSPIIGLGYRGYFDNFGKYIVDPRTGRYDKRRQYDSHNIFITALSNYGLVGFIPFVGIFLYPLIFSARILRHKDPPIISEFQKDMAVICISSIIPFMISGYFAGGLFYNPVVVCLLYTHAIFVFSANIKDNSKIYLPQIVRG